jgi:metallophosphoesterase (TIGR00282 family)
MIVLFFGDIFGKPGRRAIARALPDLIEKHSPDFIFGNIENLAGGKGVNKKAFNEMLSMGFHGFTSGNHIWDNKEVYSILETDTRLVRPANYPDFPGMPCPGSGHAVFESKGKKICIANFMGRVFMESTDCPFQAAQKFLDLKLDCPTIVDFHADATGEKYAMGFFLDGKVSAVVGTHTHVQTADERLLPKGTAYITDIGMSGSFDSCIGLKKEEIIQKYIIKRKLQQQNADENPGVSAVVIEINDDTNLAKSIERVRYTVPDFDLQNEKDLE